MICCIGYPAWHPDDLAAVARATADGAHITLMVDSVAHVEQAESVAREHKVRLPLCLEVDMTLAVPGLHFGVWRSPLQTADLARARCWNASRARSMSTSTASWATRRRWRASATTIPGQLAKNTLVRRLKGRSVRMDAERRAAVVRAGGVLCGPLRFVNGGGTGSMATTRQESAVTEIPSGQASTARRSSITTAISASARRRAMPSRSCVIPAPGIYTCLGGGYSASGGAGKDRLPSVYLPAGARLDPLEGAGEVQTPIHYRGPERLCAGRSHFDAPRQGGRAVRALHPPRLHPERRDCRMR